MGPHVSERVIKEGRSLMFMVNYYLQFSAWLTLHSILKSYHKSGNNGFLVWDSRKNLWECWNSIQGPHQGVSVANIAFRFLIHTFFSDLYNFSHNSFFLRCWSEKVLMSNKISLQQRKREVEMHTLFSATVDHLMFEV